MLYFFFLREREDAPELNAPETGLINSADLSSRLLCWERFIAFWFPERLALACIAITIVAKNKFHLVWWTIVYHTVGILMRQTCNRDIQERIYILYMHKEAIARNSLGSISEGKYRNFRLRRASLSSDSRIELTQCRRLFRSIPPSLSLSLPIYIYRHIHGPGNFHTSAYNFSASRSTLLRQKFYITIFRKLRLLYRALYACTNTYTPPG